jgi:hypothetical protein
MVAKATRGYRYQNVQISRSIALQNSESRARGNFGRDPSRVPPYIFEGSPGSWRDPFRHVGGEHVDLSFCLAPSC